MTTLETKIEMTEALYVFCQTYRRQKRRPEIAAAAAEREIQFKKELEELKAELVRTETPETPGLPLNNSGHHHLHHEAA